MASSTEHDRAIASKLPVVARAGAPLTALLAFIAETAIAIGFAAAQVPGPLALVLHGIVLLAMAAALWHAARRQRDTGPLLLLLPAVAFAGPFAAFCGIFIARLSRRGAEDVARLEAWYHRLALSTELDPTARLADQITTGRAIDFARPSAGPMDALVTAGSIAEKQAILSLIARRFHPDYLPTLRHALVSDEPVIRVQAAAVAAKIRGEMPGVVDALLREASDASASIELIVQRASEARLCVGSGLLEAKDRERAERQIEGVMARTALRLERTARQGAGLARSTIALDALATHLLAQRRYGELRRLRRMQAWARRGPWTFRPLGSRLRAVARSP